MKIDPRLPAIPPPVANPESVNAVLNAMRQRIENLTAVVLALQAAQAGQTRTLP